MVAFLAPLIPYIPSIVTVTLAGIGGFAILQIRLSVESVEEVFTNESSSLNSIAFQSILGAGAVFLFVKLIKGL